MVTEKDWFAHLNPEEQGRYLQLEAQRDEITLRIKALHKCGRGRLDTQRIHQRHAAEDAELGFNPMIRRTG